MIGKGADIDFSRSKQTRVLSKKCGYSKLIIIDSGERNECDKGDGLSVEDLSFF